MSNFYDRQGSPIDVSRWALLFEDPGYQQLKRTDVAGVVVSTVWLGLDHKLWPEGSEPLIFETMIFNGNDEEQYRYPTEAEALAHHDQLVQELELLRAAVER